MTPLEMHQSAQKHGGRYLLPLRFKEGNADKDALYKTAKNLVERGHARWLPWNCGLAPGIELTYQPWPDLIHGQEVQGRDK